ncbi:TlpA family protein disulfide reductase [candidate division KSB1 bacterium]|nr:TlpA family protein disulfide reductase [candidate division KSB1 bacterium]
MTRNRWIILGLLLVIISIFVMNPDNKDGTKTKVGNKAPSFSVTTTNGHTVALDSLRGKVVLLNFFATWCAPCNAEMPHLEAVWQRFKDKNFSVLALGREHTTQEVNIFKKQKGISFAMAPDQLRAVYRHYASKYIPRSYVIDKNGTIVFQTKGYDPYEFELMIEVIEAEIAK